MSSSSENWVTINGVHVLIGASGKIEKGPAKFIGSTVDDMKKSGKSTVDRKAELQKKRDAKSGAKSTKSAPKKEEKQQKSGSQKSTSTQKSVLERAKMVDNKGDPYMTIDGKAVHSFPNGKVRFTDGTEISVSKAEQGKLIDTFLGGSLKPSKSSTPKPTKYPTGIDTPAQKRAYTRAINSGKSTSEATKIAKGNDKSPSTHTSKSSNPATVSKGLSTEEIKRRAEATERELLRKGYGRGRKMFY